MSDEPNTEVAPAGDDMELAGDERELAGGEIAVPGDASLAEELAAEHALWRSVFWGMVIAVPICVVIWCAMVAIAVGPDGPEDWFAWLGIGALVGVIAGAFFGGWAGFTAKAHLLDEVDFRGSHH